MRAVHDTPLTDGETLRCAMVHPFSAKRRGTPLEHGKQQARCCYDLLSGLSL